MRRGRKDSPAREAFPAAKRHRLPSGRAPALVIRGHNGPRCRSGTRTRKACRRGCHDAWKRSHRQGADRCGGSPVREERDQARCLASRRGQRFPHGRQQHAAGFGNGAENAGGLANDRAHGAERLDMHELLPQGNLNVVRQTVAMPAAGAKAARTRSTLPVFPPLSSPNSIAGSRPMCPMVAGPLFEAKILQSPPRERLPDRALPRAERGPRGRSASG